MLLRRSVGAAVNLVSWRHMRYSMASSWMWAGIIDYRRTAVDREALVDQLLFMHDELGDSWFGRIILDML